jgi:TRAP transporter TAXI family solute receptor
MINKYAPMARITVVETGAGYDNIKRMQRGDIHLATIGISDGLYYAYHGEGAFEGNQFSDIRVLYIEYEYVFHTAVRADTEIYALSDLEGKKFSYGIPGSGAERTAATIFETLNINPDRFIGGLGDAAAAMKDRRIDGLFKASTVYFLDATFADINVFTPIRLLSISDQEWSLLAPVLTGFFLFTIPAGVISGLEDHEPVSTVKGVTYVYTTKDLDEELSYNIAKALDENWQELTVVPAYGVPPDPIETLLGTLYSDGQVIAPLHSGSVRYLQEKGIEVPDAIIPPEY